ncbi:MAG: ThiF family adenylyltransferase [Chloracidobacterium sp.]|nr:ThiF family adenylyltransferase [Chloracidobacterium sp.]
MSQKLINHSPDLKRLRDEGYVVRILDAFLIVNTIPYVNAQKEVKYGTLVSHLTVAAGAAVNPVDNHVAFWIGEHPCNNDGSEILAIKHSSGEQTLADGLLVGHSFSNKPEGGYPNYFEKMNTYAEIISAPAASIDPRVTPKSFRVVESDDDNSSVFHYPDSNSSRAHIYEISQKLKPHKLAIVGLGGTGSYLLDLIAKTPVAEIHLFDGDLFCQHNAFRSPGAPSAEDLDRPQQKVNYFAELYGKMHKRIIAHPVHVTAANVDELEEMNFVFLAMDGGTHKATIINKLEQSNVAFIDTGIGLDVTTDELIGQIRVTCSTANHRGHVKNRIDVSDADPVDLYQTNIQIAELNAMAAVLAVIKWKKMAKFFQDLGEEHNSIYAINTNELINEDS